MSCLVEKNDYNTSLNKPIMNINFDNVYEYSIDELNNMLNDCEDMLFTDESDTDSLYNKTKGIFECCNTEMSKGVENTLICSICNKNLEYFGELNNDHTSCTNTRMIVYGKNSKHYRHKIFTSNQHNYQKLQNDYIEILISKMQMNSPDIKFSTQIMMQSKQLCFDIVRYNKFRKDFIIEIITAAISEICIINRHIIQDSQLIAFTGLKGRSYNKAMKIIREMKSKKILELPNPPDILDLTIQDFGQKLGLDDKYIQMAAEIIKVIDDKLLIQCMVSSKVAGVYYYILTLLIEFGLHPNVNAKTYVGEKLFVKSTTFIKTNNCVKITYHSLFKNILKKYELLKVN